MEKTLTQTTNQDYFVFLNHKYNNNDTPLIIATPSHMGAKRVMDVCISVTAMVFIMSWFYPIMWFLIRYSSSGPVLFKQLRHGKDNVPFYCLKFRTMVVNDLADTCQATRKDPRVTKIGSFLRKTSLDEIPQIINVLKGEMSIVGPRPHPIQLNEKFSKDIKHLMCRHIVKPGITGLAQAKGYRGETAEFFQMNSRCRLDLFYIKNWSMWLDAKIIVLTFLALINDTDKAY